MSSGFVAFLANAAPGVAVGAAFVLMSFIQYPPRWWQRKKEGQR